MWNSKRVTQAAWTNGDIDQAAVNFFNAFGFLKVPGFFTPEIKAISREFDVLMRDKFGDTSEERNYLYPQFIDNSQKLADLLTLPKLSSLMSALMGPDFVYKGSDGNIFSASTGWHRDYLIRTKSCKLLVYLENIDESSGALRVIPGTHFVDDAYSSFIGSALTWPEPAVGGGFDEKKVFGTGHSPQVLGQNSVLPQTVIRNQPGDIILFNHNLIHCTNASARRNRRRLIGLHFCVNPATALADMNKETQDEIRTLSLVEMDSFKLPKMFGPYVYDHPSPVVQRMIGPLKDLSLQFNSEFNGLYLKQSDWSINFCNRLKGNQFLSRKKIN